LSPAFPFLGVRLVAGPGAQERAISRNDEALLFCALLLISLLSALDYWLTLHILARGGFEANPLFGDLVSAEPVLTYWLKFLLTTLGVLALGLVARMRLARPAIFGMLAVYGCVTGWEVALLGWLS